MGEKKSYPFAGPVIAKSEATVQIEETLIASPYGQPERVAMKRRRQITLDEWEKIKGDG